MYSCNNTALIISALVDSGPTHSFINKSLVQGLLLGWPLLHLQYPTHMYNITAALYHQPAILAGPYC